MTFRKSALVLVLFALVAAGCSGENPITDPTASLSSTSTAIAPGDELKDVSRDGLETEASPNTVVLPAGSSDGLAAAIAAAGPNGKVIVQAGTHTESNTVTITQPIEIVGEPGALLVCDTNPYLSAPGVVDPALYVLGTTKVSIRGLEMKPAAAIGGVAILLENAHGNAILNNKITDFQEGVLLAQADRTLIRDNVIAASPAWRSGAIPGTFPIVVMNGDGAQIIGNDLSNGVFNVFACDENGTLAKNRVHDGRIGIILCKVPPGSYQLPSGTVTGAENPCTSWMVHQNNAESNAIGYLVIDSAHDNTLVDNAAANNARYDMELTADTFRFGFLTPASFDNTVRAGRHNIRIKDCGNNNTVVGGQLVDNTTDPCN